MRIFSLYCLILFFLFIPVFYFRFISPSSNSRFIFLRIFMLAEFTCLSLFFYNVIKSYSVKKIIYFLIFPFVLISNYDYLIQNSNNFSYFPLVVECILVLMYILFYFYEKMKLNTTVPGYQTRSFWIAVAFTLFCSGNFFLFLYSNNSIKDEVYKIQYTLIYSTFTILKNLFICIGLSIKEVPIEENNKKLIIPDDVWEIPAEYKKPKP